MGLVVEETTTTIEDPISRMIWHLGADNRARYPHRVQLVFKNIGLGGDLHQAAIKFVEMVKQNPEGVESKLMGFIISQRRRQELGEVKAGTIRNYIKALKTFCEMNRISSRIE